MTPAELAKKLREAADLRERMTPGKWRVCPAYDEYNRELRTKMLPDISAAGDIDEANATGIAALVNLCTPAMLRAMADVVEATTVLTAAVGDMKVPQTIQDAAIQITFTLGPAFESATAALAALTRAQEN